MSSSSRSHRSRFLTGCLEAVRQPLRCQLASQPSVKAFFRYWLSVTIVTAHGSVSASRARTAAVSSIRLFVVPAS